MGTATAEIKVLRAGTAGGLDVLGQRVTFLDDPEDTGDALFMYEVRSPAGGMVPAHTEKNHEAFYVTEGSFEITLDGETATYGPGDFLCIAPGVPHAFSNPGPGEASMVVTVSPGAQHKRFFEATGEPLDPGVMPELPEEPPDFDRIAAIGARSGIIFLPPEDQAS